MPQLGELGLATKVDSVALVILARTYSEWRRADAEYRKTGLLVVRGTGDKGVEVTNPVCIAWPVTGPLCM